ncbi:unnamed protein product, partial [Ectocarpus sp. 8 AP-2014]
MDVSVSQPALSAANVSCSNHSFTAVHKDVERQPSMATSPGLITAFTQGRLKPACPLSMPTCPVRTTAYTQGHLQFRWRHVRPTFPTAVTPADADADAASAAGALSPPPPAS